MASYIGGVYIGGNTDPYDKMDDSGNLEPGRDEAEWDTYRPGYSAPITLPAMPGRSEPLPVAPPGSVRPDFPESANPGLPPPPLSPDPPGGWGGWTPPSIGGWQPPHFDLAPGPRTLPWEPVPGGGIDLTPGPRSGLPWIDPSTGGIDLTPGPGTGVPGAGALESAFDMAAMLPLMLLMMVMKN